MLEDYCSKTYVAKFAAEKIKESDSPYKPSKKILEQRLDDWISKNTHRCARGNGAFTIPKKYINEIIEDLSKPILLNPDHETSISDLELPLSYYCVFTLCKNMAVIDQKQLYFLFRKEEQQNGTNRKTTMNVPVISPRNELYLLRAKEVYAFIPEGLKEDADIQLLMTRAKLDANGNNVPITTSDYYISHNQFNLIITYLSRPFKVSKPVLNTGGSRYQKQAHRFHRMSSRYDSL